MVNIKDTAPESEEQKFKQKCNELRKRIAEVEESNEISTLALSRTRYSIRRLRLEYSILLERIESKLPIKEINDLSGYTESEFRKPLLLNEDLDTKFQCTEKYKSVKPKDAPSLNSSKKEIRDPNMPKRPTNAYFMFCERERENIRADIERKNPGQPIIDFPRVLTEIWKGMDERERMPYWKLFLEDRDRYHSEMQIYSNKKRSFDEISDMNVNDNNFKLDGDETSVGLNDSRSDSGINNDLKKPDEGVMIFGHEEKTNNPEIGVDGFDERNKQFNGQEGEVRQGDNSERKFDENHGDQRSQTSLGIKSSEHRGLHDKTPQETAQISSNDALTHGKVLDAHGVDGAVGKEPSEQ